MTPHNALSALVSLAKKPPASRLDPDPFQVLLAEVTSERASAPGITGSLLPKSAWKPYATYPRCSLSPPGTESAAGAPTLHTAVAKDPASEVKKPLRRLSKRWRRACYGLLAAVLWNLVNILESRLRFSGRAVDDESLRALVNLRESRRQTRLSAAQLLSMRGVTSAAPDLRAALLSGAFLDRDLALLAHALLQLDGAEAVKAVVEARRAGSGTPRPGFIWRGPGTERRAGAL